MAYFLKQSSTAKPLLFLMIDATDHIAGKTGLAPAVTLSKNGAAFASPAGAVTELANGWYKVAGNATDTGTPGPLVLHATASGADPTDEVFMVVAFDPDAATNLGLSALPTANPAAAGGLPTIGAGAGQINPSSGKVPATLAASDISGNVAVDVVIPTADQVADAVLSRNVSHVEADSPRTSLATSILATTNKANTADHEGYLTVYRTDGVTEHVRIPISARPGADPIEGVG